MSRLALSIVLLALTPAALAQAPIRATVTQHPDGGQSVMVVDPDKQTAEETQTDANKKVVRKVTYLLDERNQPIAGITYDGKGKVLYRASYKRDSYGRIDEENITTEAGQFLRRRVYTYGPNNKVVNMVEYDAAGNPLVTPRRSAPAATPFRGRPDKKKR